MNTRTARSRRLPHGWIVRSLIVIFTLHAAHFALRPMASYRALELGADPVGVGIIAGSYAVLGLVLAMPIGRLTDRFGETPLMITGIALTSVVALSLGWVPNLLMLGVAMALLGLAHLAALIGVQTLFGNAGGSSGRDARFGALAVVGSAGHMVGPLIAGWLAAEDGTASPRLFVTFAVLAAIASAVAVTLLIRPPHQREPRRASSAPRPSTRATVRLVFRIPSVPQTMFVSMTMMTSIDIMIAYLPVYGQANNIPVTTITTLLSVRAAAAVVSRLSVVPLLNLIGRKRVLLTATFVPGLMVLVLPMTTDPLILGAILVTAGFGLGLGQPMTTSWVAGRVPAEIRGAAMGLRLTGNKFGQLALPAAFGAVAGATGIGAVFIALGGLLITGGGLLARTPLDDK